MPLQIGPQIGKGGEATVHEVVGRHDMVIKVYLNPRPVASTLVQHGRASLPIETKLTAMIRHNRRRRLSAMRDSHVSVAWPQQVLTFADGRVGYTMHYARGTQPLYLIYNPREVAIRRWNIDGHFLRRVAHNVAVTVNAIHDAGYVIGDLNESNILVTSRGLVTFIDTDSFQVKAEERLLLCTVAKPHYLAPELVNRDLRAVARDRTHDHFALGVLIFQLLMGGRHPFAGVWPREAGDPPPLEEWIRRGLFAYSGSCYVGGRRIEPPPAAPRVDNLDRRVRDYFDRCFVLGHKDPRQRPSAGEWSRLLRNLDRPPIPETPQVISVANPNAGTSAELKFELPKDVTEDQIAGYDLQKRLSGQPWSDAWAPTRVPSTQRQYTFTGLARQSTYVFRVRAYNSSGNGVWSDDSPQQFIPADPVAPPVRRFSRRLLLVGIVLGVVLFYVVTDRPSSGDRASHEDIGSTAPPEDRGGALSREDDDSTAPREGNGGAVSRENDGGAASPGDDYSADTREQNGSRPSREDDESTASREANGNAASTDEPSVEANNRTYPRIRSLVRLEPSDHWTKADSVTWRITFTEAVTNVDQRDFDIIGIGPWRLTVSKVGELGDVYDITLGSHGLADHNGTLTLGFSPSPYIKNVAGNRLSNVNAVGVYEASFVVDNAAPTVTFHPESGRIGDAGANLTMTFSEAVYSDSSRKAFTASTLAGLIDIRTNAESGAPIPFTASIDTDNDTVTIDPTGTLLTRTWVRMKSTYYDTVGNEGGMATATFTLDTTRPTVTIDGVPATDSGAFMATLTFSEAVTGLTASDVVVTNGTASALTEANAGRQWYVRITPTGNYGVSLPVDRVTDLAGNGNMASTSHDGSYDTDVTDPRLISIVRQTPSSSPTPADSITWRVTFSEDVQHFKTSSVNLLDQSNQVIRRGADRVSAVGGSESVYDVTFSEGVLANYRGRVKLNFQLRSDDNSYSVNVQDKATRALLCCKTLGTDERTFDMDNAAPQVAGIVRSSPSQEHTNDDEVAWRVTFSEPVKNGLSGRDFTISGTDAAITVTQEGSSSRSWNVLASGGNLASLNGTITLSFSGTRDIDDLAGNVLADAAPTGANENSFVIDNISPGLISIVRQSSNSWSLTFNEDMQGVEATDFAIHGATLAVAAAGSQSIYDLSASGGNLASVQGRVSLYFKGDGDIADLAGNALRAPRPPATLTLPS